MPRVLRKQLHENVDAGSTSSSSNDNTAAVNRKKLQLGLKLQQIGENGVNATNKRKAMEAENKQPSKRRAALGEITNAFGSIRNKVGLKSSKSSSQPTVAVAPQPKAKKTVAPIKKPPRAIAVAARTTRRSVEVLRETKSLPSTQEDKQAPLGVHTKDINELDLDDDEVSVYESADEGDDEAESGDEQEAHSDHEGGDQLPAGVNDFDGDNSGDPNQVSEYAKDVFQYYKNREVQFRVPDYMKVVQNEVSPHMRAVLVDWLVEVQESFELNHETLYTAVKMIDIYLSQVRVKKEDLQLIGATACLIASKIDERMPPTLNDFVYVCDEAYDENDLKRKEIELIRAVDFDVGYPLSYRFLRRYARVCGFDMERMTFGRYVLEMALMDYSLNVNISESQLAAAALALTARVHGIAEETWKANLEHYSGYKPIEYASLFKKFHQMVLKPIGAGSTRKTIRTKYSHKVFHFVALVQIPATLTL